MKNCIFLFGLLIFLSSCEERIILESRNQDPIYSSVEILVSYQNNILLDNEDLSIDIYATREDALHERKPIANIKPDLQGRATKGFLDVMLGNIYIRVNEPQFGSYIGVESLVPDVKSFHFIDFASGYYYDEDDVKIKAPKGISFSRPMVGQKSKYERFSGKSTFFNGDEIYRPESITLEIVEYLKDGQYRVIETIEDLNLSAQDIGAVDRRENIWKFDSGVLKLLPSNGNEINSQFFGPMVTFGYNLDYSSRPTAFVNDYIKDNPTGYYRFFNMDLPYGLIPESRLRMINNFDIDSPSYLQFFTPEEGFLKVFIYGIDKSLTGYNRVAL